MSNYKSGTPRSGVPGISWHAANGNWVVRHKVKGVEQFLGSFDDPRRRTAGERASDATARTQAATAR